MARRSGPSEILRYSHLGIQFAVVVLAAIWAGNRLDRRLSTSGVFTLLGTFLGAGIGFYLLHRELYRRTGKGKGDAPGPPADSADAGPRDGGARDGGGDPGGASRRD